MTRGQRITTPPADLSGLVRLCHHRWMIPLVAVLGRDRGSRFAVLLRELGVARATLERALQAADRLDLVMRNPGRGHPLRPEYLLTPFGEAIAAECLVLHRLVADPASAELAYRKWSLPVLAALRTGGPRFSELQGALPSVSPRALALALDDLGAAGWLRRVVHDERPPRPSYHLERRGQNLARAATALAEAAR